MSLLKLYRAVSINHYDETLNYPAQKTQRAPSNVPYLVDNIWEYLRPEHFPSRRHAIYASPTIELSLTNASAGMYAEQYVACEVLVNMSDIKVAHLRVTDAKLHPDVRNLPKIILNHLNFNDLTIAEKSVYASLFMPSVRREEIVEASKNTPKIQEILTLCEKHSTFWADALDYSDETSLGELFFELNENASYKLHKTL